MDDNRLIENPAKPAMITTERKHRGRGFFIRQRDSRVGLEPLNHVFQRDRAAQHHIEVDGMQCVFSFKAVE